MSAPTALGSPDDAPNHSASRPVATRHDLTAAEVSADGSELPISSHCQYPAVIAMYFAGGPPLLCVHGRAPSGTISRAPNRSGRHAETGSWCDIRGAHPPRSTRPMSAPHSRTPSTRVTAVQLEPDWSATLLSSRVGENVMALHGELEMERERLQFAYSPPDRRTHHRAGDDDWRDRHRRRRRAGGESGSRPGDRRPRRRRVRRDGLWPAIGI